MPIAYFTPLTGAGGGALIGLTAAILLLFSGDILAADFISSSTLLSPRKILIDPSSTWKLVFLSSFLLISNTVLGIHFSYDERLGDDPSIPIVSLYGYLIGGFLQGFGTRLSNGCTSGHGICGMARLSKRSIIAVCTFMASASVTATVTAPDMPFSNKITDFLRTDKVPKFYNRWLGFGVSMYFVFLTSYAIYNLWRGNKQIFSNRLNYLQRHFSNQVVDIQSQSPENQEAQTKLQQNENNTNIPINESISKLIPAAIAGGIFAVGLAVSQMVLQSKVFGFLNLYLFVAESYDPTLITVMGGGCAISWISYQFVKPFGLIPNPHARECPILVSKFDIPTSRVINAQLVVGAFCFGIGWAVCGFCPGPALFLAACGSELVLYCWWPTFIVGSFLAEKTKIWLDPKISEQSLEP